MSENTRQIVDLIEQMSPDELRRRLIAIEREQAALRLLLRATVARQRYADREKQRASRTRKVFNNDRMVRGSAEAVHA